MLYCGRQLGTNAYPNYECMDHRCTSPIAQLIKLVSPHVLLGPYRQ